MFARVHLFHRGRSSIADWQGKAFANKKPRGTDGVFCCNRMVSRFGANKAVHDFWKVLEETENEKIYRLFINSRSGGVCTNLMRRYECERQCEREYAELEHGDHHERDADANIDTDVDAFQPERKYEC